MSYEESYKALSDIVATLEKGDKSLDESIELYKNGIELAKECKDKLSQAKLTVENLGQESE